MQFMQAVLYFAFGILVGFTSCLRLYSYEEEEYEEDVDINGALNNFFQDYMPEDVKQEYRLHYSEGEGILMIGKINQVTLIDDATFKEICYEDNFYDILYEFINMYLYFASSMTEGEKKH